MKLFDSANKTRGYLDLDLPLAPMPLHLFQNWQPIEAWEPSAQVVMVSSSDQLEVALLETNNLSFPVFRVGKSDLRTWDNLFASVSFQEDAYSDRNTPHGPARPCTFEHDQILLHVSPQTKLLMSLP